MKKRLLFVMVALMGWVGMSATDYVYTTDARYKLTGENLVLNGDFTEQNLGDISTFGWSQNTTDTPLSTDAWAIAPGVGLNGENALERKDGSASELCQIVPLTAEAYYVISFDIKANANFTSVIEQGKTNSIDVYVNASGTADKTATDESHYFKQIATTINVTDQWQTVAFALVPDTAIATFAVISMEQLPAGTQITNVKVVEAEPVYDLRIAERALNWAQRMYEEPAFTKGKDDFITVMNQLKQVMANERASENESTMMNQVERLNSALETYLDENTDNIAKNTFFNYIEDLEDMPQYNRGNIADGQTIGGFLFRGKNWQHGVYRGANNAIINGPNGKKGLPYIQKAIQAGGPDPGPGSIALVNQYMPAGKYFIAADMFNASQDAKYIRTYDMEATVKGFIKAEDTDSIDLGTISGEGYKRLYFIKELKEGEKLELGFWWDGPTSGGQLFEITNFQVRSFTKGVADLIDHQKAFEAYMAQWNAVNNARQKTYSLQNQPMYPWGQNELKTALETWEPLFSAQYTKWWSDNDGKDTGKATTDELKDWTNYQGVDTASVAERYKKFGLVRGFQDANNALIALNQPFADLKEAIEAAKAERLLGKNAQGNRDTFKAAIETAMSTLKETIAKTTDATRVADSTTIANAITALNEAKATFLKQVEDANLVTTLVDLDFSVPVEVSYVEEEGTVTDSIFTLKGAEGTAPMIISKTFNRDTTQNGSNHFELGYMGQNKEMLRIGKGTATVDFGEVQDGDVVTITFDMYFGQLQKRFVSFELTNKDDEHVAGMYYYVNSDWTIYQKFSELGIDVGKIARAGSKPNTDNVTILDGAKKTSFEIVFDYGKQRITTTMVSEKNGTFVTDTIINPNSLENYQIAKFVLASDFDNSARRCWFDNLKITKMSSVPADMEEDITGNYWPEEKPWEENYTTGIREVGNSSVKTPIYSIFGTRLQSIPQKGLYIMNGKKFVVK